MQGQDVVYKVGRKAHCNAGQREPQSRSSVLAHRRPCTCLSSSALGPTVSDLWHPLSTSALAPWHALPTLTCVLGMRQDVVEPLESASVNIIKTDKSTITDFGSVQEARHGLALANLTLHGLPC